MRRTRWGGRWPRRSCTRRATRCGAGPTRSCGGSWRAGWGCDDDSGWASQRGGRRQRGSIAARNERGTDRPRRRRGAGWALPAPAEPLPLAVTGAVTAEPVDDGDGPGRWRLTGTATDVAWAGVARHVAVLAAAPEGIEGAVLALVDAEGLATSDARNLAGEPRGSLVLGGAPAAGALLTPARAGEGRARYALARAVQLAAALEQVLAWTVQYAGERHQF